MITGSLVALVTPMKADGAIDFEALERLVERQVLAGTAAIISVGTSGESSTLTVAEHTDVIRRTIDAAGGRVQVIAGTGANNTDEAIHLTKAAAAAGADGALLVTPYYNKPPQEGLFQHFTKVAEAVDLPQYLYNVPGRTACDMLPSTVERLAEVPNIVGLKEAKGDLDRVRDLVALGLPDFALYSGDDATARASMLAGFHGDISVTANVAPEQMARMCKAAVAGDAEEAATIDADLAGLHRALFVEANPIPVKWALAEMGLIERGIRLPLVELDEWHHEDVRAALRMAGLLEN
ncbi:MULTISPECIES: 4-hydroxy-tetrahydrodipicolinate synthase [Pseudonocardia]|uniref:4-hydroxy-tetrahydrodipicolinate synthase n=1 Tax=Pseudonocardia oroxyli TaxID=366584 RepID=A0A1G7W957_PSEOR|nr:MULTISPECIES: 4-hydroxy-tetrahydrodipicolinate synthase [Pseudonocardia]MCF7547707.1 4-hydroxy-tetrahydrodipicolinate synthase [Pseudonocardia sp. WMMC193]SDG68525.1 4-hydroxy-tetrahydrodipicolinate synthase [Pseudonocardia oroxyli]